MQTAHATDKLTDKTATATDPAYETLEDQILAAAAALRQDYYDEHGEPPEADEAAALSWVAEVPGSLRDRLSDELAELHDDAFLHRTEGACFRE